MTTDFVHLHVASGFSMQYGVSTPATLVDRAAQWGQPALALTDRDGLYGAVRFAQAAQAAGIGAVHGVDLACRPVLLADQRRPSAARRVADGPGGQSGSGGAPRTPVRGGAQVDERLPRVTVLARGSGIGAGRGWARLCRLVTATHLAGERGTPVTSLDLLAEHALDPDTGHTALRVLLGPDSDVGRAVLRRRHGEARARLQAWQAGLPRAAVVLETTWHEGPSGTVGSRSQARALVELADEAGVPVVLTGAVRYADPSGAATADVLDAARRLVALDTRHLDRVTTSGHLASTEQMTALAHRLVGSDRAEQLLADTRRVADDTLQDPRHDLGIGSVQLPEPAVLDLGGVAPGRALAERTRAAVAARYPDRSGDRLRAVHERLDDELAVVADLGYASYFLTVSTVTDLIREMGGRVAARGSGAGSLINYLLGISGVDPIRYDLLMERFCSPLRAALPDIDIDVESDRRTAIYERVLDRFGGERVTCVSMMDTYQVRHAIRDVGAALGLPPTEIDAIAKAFPHIRARDARNAIDELPELRASGLAAPRLATLFELVERLDGLPRHIALHPCGMVLSNSSLLDRTPVEASWLGFPMSHFDKDDVETMGLLKLDVLGIRMQSAMAHAVAEVERVDQVHIDLDDQAQVPLDDEATFRLIRSTHTLGCFQIESPGQRELIGKFGPQRFEDLIIDISLFRPGPVKSDMITPFLRARGGWDQARYLHPSLVPALAETEGVVVFHEQVLQIVSVTAGVSLAQADEVRRALGTPAGQEEVEAWWRPAAAARGYTPEEVDTIWAVLKAFASFGFCKAHAAAFALPTYQSAWLKTHHPAAFLAGVLTHDPGMYPKRLILDDARNLGIAILSLDVNASGDTYLVEPVAPFDEPPPGILGEPPRSRPVHPDLPDARAYGIRLSLSDVKGISDAEVQRIIAGRPYFSLADLWHRAQPSRPIVERLVVAGALDSVYGIGGHLGSAGLGRRGRITRRDLLLHVAELDRYSRALSSGAARTRAGSGRGGRGGGARAGSIQDGGARAGSARAGAGGSAGGSAAAEGSPRARDVRAAAAAQSQAAQVQAAAADRPAQLTLDLGDAPELTTASGLPELSDTERVRAELDVLGLDASSHVVQSYAPLLDALGVTRSADLLTRRSRSEILVAGVKVATQTPPVRSGRRVVFLTLDDATGPVDATFFEDVQGPYAATVFHSWMLLVRGEVRRTGARGISLRATGAWELGVLWEQWMIGGLEAVLGFLREHDAREQALRAQAAGELSAGSDEAAVGVGASARRVLVHASGFKQSPYADTRPAGSDPRDARRLAERLGRLPVDGERTDHRATAPRKLWHASPGSSGH
ncbi:DNA polymerase III subunit alpha [Arsenicicoccus piscis]|nr:DNA polymerase III subunit alpha [Arsenicicoccus piscis]